MAKSHASLAGHASLLVKKVYKVHKVTYDS